MRGLLRLRTLLLSTAFAASVAPTVQAAMVPRPAKITLCQSADYDEMIFVVYRIKEVDDPWATGIRVDPSSGIIVPADKGVDVPFGCFGCAVLAVPRALAQQSEQMPDPAWLEPSAPGVVRVPGLFRIPGFEWYEATLHYRLQNGAEGPELVLLNPEAVEAYHEKRRAESQSRAAEDAKDNSAQLWPMFGVLSGCVLLILIGAWSFVSPLARVFRNGRQVRNSFHSEPGDEPGGPSSP